jgi:hypothetical protein
VADPTPFLSTIAGVSATLVAIIGGLLVARFVSLDSEQQGAQQLVDDAAARLTTARNRAVRARQDLYSWDVNSFFKTDVVTAIGRGEHDVVELRDIGDVTYLSDDTLRHVVGEIRAEFDEARRVLSELVTPRRPGEAADWDAFKRSQRGQLPEMSWEDAWRIVYADLSSPRLPPETVALARLASTMVPSVAVTRPREYVVLDVQRRDALQADMSRAEQREEDVEAELARLQLARDAVVRPKGLGWGLVVLAVFTVVGVIIPVWLLSRAPRLLTVRLGEVVFWLFLAGLLLLLGYMSVLAMRLSGRWQKLRADADRTPSAVWRLRVQRSKPSAHKAAQDGTAEGLGGER